VGDARKLLASGIDPMANSVTKKIANQASAMSAFQPGAFLWWGHWHSAKSARHVDDVMRCQKADVFTAIGARMASKIQARALATMV
jgi:hypothetical protein